jgi:hypothetical protein
VRFSPPGAGPMRHDARYDPYASPLVSTTSRSRPVARRTTTRLNVVGLRTAIACERYPDRHQRRLSRGSTTDRADESRSQSLVGPRPCGGACPGPRRPRAVPGDRRSVASGPAGTNAVRAAVPTAYPSTRPGFTWTESFVSSRYGYSNRYPPEWRPSQADEADSPDWFLAPGPRPARLAISGRPKEDGMTLRHADSILRP